MHDKWYSMLDFISSFCNSRALFRKRPGCVLGSATRLTMAVSPVSPSLARDYLFKGLPHFFVHHSVYNRVTSTVEHGEPRGCSKVLIRPCVPASFKQQASHSNKVWRPTEHERAHHDEKSFRSPCFSPKLLLCFTFLGFFFRRRWGGHAGRAVFDGESHRHCHHCLQGLFSEFSNPRCDFLGLDPRRAKYVKVAVGHDHERGEKAQSENEHGVRNVLSPVCGANGLVRDVCVAGPAEHGEKGASDSMRPDVCHHTEGNSPSHDQRILERLNNCKVSVYWYGR